MKRLGIFGGSFNPVHTGHCVIAQHFVHHARLDSCVFVPTFISPFKTDEPTVAEAYRRLTMLRSVCRTNPRFAVSEVELQRKDVSYTILTLRYFRERYPDTELMLLIGQDLLSRFGEWREWEEIVRIATVCIARRNGELTAQERSMVERITATGNTPKELFPPRIDISSSLIRSMCARGESVAYVVPDGVRRIIRRHHLYRPSGNELTENS